MATPLGKYLTLEEFCTCTETYRKFKDEVYPYPDTDETLEALRALNQNLIDPLIDHYGRERFILVYGFCSETLRRKLQKRNPITNRPYGRVAPACDQHMAHESKKNGDPHCAKLGAACDFKIQGENPRQVIRWMLESGLPFDRIYFYGEDRAIHVSYGPDHSRYICGFNCANMPSKEPVKELIELVKKRYQI